MKVTLVQCKSTFSMTPRNVEAATIFSGGGNIIPKEGAVGGGKCQEGGAVSSETVHLDLRVSIRVMSSRFFH